MPPHKGRKQGSQAAHRGTARNAQSARAPKTSHARTPVNVDTLKGKDMSNYKQIVTHYDNRNYKQGLKQSLQFLKHQPDVADVIAFKGLFMQNLTGDGIPIIKEAVAFDPTNYMPEYLLGLGYKDCDKVTKAITHLEKARSLFTSSAKDNSNGISNELVQLYTIQGSYKNCLSLVDKMEDTTYKQNAQIFYHYLLNSLDKKTLETEIPKEYQSQEVTATRKEHLSIIAMLAFGTQETVSKYEANIRSNETKIMAEMGMNKPFIYSNKSFKDALLEVMKENPNSFTYQIALLVTYIVEAQHPETKDELVPENISKFPLQEFMTLFCKTKYSFTTGENTTTYNKLSTKYPSLFDHTEIKTSDIPYLYEYIKDISDVVKDWKDKCLELGAKELTIPFIYGLVVNDVKIIVDTIKSLKTVSPKEFKILLRMGKIEMYDAIMNEFKDIDKWFYVGMLRQKGEIEQGYETIKAEITAIKGEEKLPELLMIEKMRLEILLMNNHSEKFPAVDPLETSKQLLETYGKGNRYLTTLCVHKLLGIRSFGEKTDVFMYCIEIFSKFIKGDWLCNLYDMQDYVLLYKFAMYLYCRNEAGVETTLPYGLDKFRELHIKEQFAFSLFMKLLIVLEQFVVHLVDYYRYILRRNLVTDAFMLLTSVRNTFRTKPVRRALAQITAMLTQKETEKRSIPDDRKKELDEYVLNAYKKNWEETGQAAQDIEYEKIRSSKDMLCLNINIEKVLGKLNFLYTEGDPVDSIQYVEKLMSTAQLSLLEYPEENKAQKLSRAGLLMVQQTTFGRINQVCSIYPKETSRFIREVSGSISRAMRAKNIVNELIDKKFTEFGIQKGTSAKNVDTMYKLAEEAGISGDELISVKILLSSFNI